MENIPFTADETKHLRTWVPSLKFVQPDIASKWFHCVICNEQGTHFYYPDCQHVICVNCKEKETEKECPSCNTPVSDEVLDVLSLKEIADIETYCPYNNQMCSEKFYLSNFMSHYNECHTDETISSASSHEALPEDDIQKLKRETLQMRQMVETLKENWKIMQENEKEWRKKLELMEQKLKYEVERRMELENLIKEKIGHISELENSLEPQDLAFSNYHDSAPELQTVDLNSSGDSHLSSTNRAVGFDKKSTTYIWRIHGFSHKLRDLKNHLYGELSSETFSTEDYGFKMRANLCYIEPYDYLSLFLGFVKVGVGLQPIPPIYYHRRMVLVCDRSGENKDIVRIYEPGFGKSDAEKWMRGFYGWRNFCPMNLLLKDDRYVENDTLTVKIVVEPLVALYKTFSSNVGVLFWRLDSYSQKKAEEMQEIVQHWRSDYFYSGRSGYRLQVRLHLNGLGEYRGSYLSLFLWFLKGQYDDELPDKFHYRLTCTVLDQTISFTKQDLVKITEREDEKFECGYGFPNFALQSEIENALYLRNDTLLLKVVVEPL